MKMPSRFKQKKKMKELPAGTIIVSGIYGFLYPFLPTRRCLEKSTSYYGGLLGYAALERHGLGYRLHN